MTPTDAALDEVAAYRAAKRDDYAYWQDALSGKFGPIHEGDPQCGFYRMRRKGQVDQPVAIWRDHHGFGSTLLALVGGYDADAEAIWTYVATRPITEATYRAVMAGEPWPDLAPSITAPINSESADPAAILRDQIDAAKADLARYAEIADDTTMSAAQSLRSRLLELCREADKTREREKAPHLEAGKAVDAKWQPLVKDAKAAADTVAKAMSTYATAKARREEAERVAAALAARAAEDMAERNVPPPPPAEKPAPVKGAYGRAASIRTVRVARVVDQDRLYEAVKNNTEVKALLQKIAQAIVTAGETVAGVEIAIEQKVQ